MGSTNNKIYGDPSSIHDDFYNFYERKERAHQLIACKLHNREEDVPR